MPKTIQAVPPPPIKEVINTMHKSNITSTQPLLTVQDEKEYTVVARQSEKNTLSIFEETSTTFVPLVLPPDTVLEEHEHKTTFIFPVTVKVTAKNSRNIFKNTRIAVAVLRAFQLVDKVTYLAPIKEMSDNDPISKSSDIPTDAEEILEYAEDPRKGKYNSYTMRLYIKANKDLNYFKMDHNFKPYLASQAMVIEYNNLESANPINVGFLDNIIACPDMANLYATRIENLLPHGSPRFNVTIQALHGPNRTLCRVFMIKCDKKYVAQLVKLIIEHKTPMFEFFPFQSFLNMEDGKKFTVVNNQNKFTNEHRSLLLNGFIDNDDNIPMFVEDEEEMELSEQEMELSKTTVSNYLRYNIRATGGEPLFSYVYPPIKGVREFLVTINNYYDALSYLESGRVELVRMMNPAAAELILEDADEAMDLAVIESPWELYEKASKVVATNYEKLPRSAVTNPNKRAKTVNTPRIIVLESDVNNNTKGNKSYANSVRRNNPHGSNNTLSTVTSHTKIDLEKITNMELQVTELQQKFEQKMIAIEKSTSVLIEKRINLAVQSINVDMDNKFEANNKRLNENIEEKLKMVTKESNKSLLADFKLLLAGNVTSTDTIMENDENQSTNNNNNNLSTTLKIPSITERICDKYQKLTSRKLPVQNATNQQEYSLTTVDDCEMGYYNANDKDDYNSSTTELTTSPCR
jgi:hypothetical protein